MGLTLNRGVHMPITPFHSKSDPFAWLASAISSVVLALEKLRQRFVLDPDDLDALKRTSEKFASLSKANELRERPYQQQGFESLSADVRSDFFTLVAIQSSLTTPVDLPDFDMLAARLEHIVDQYSDELGGASAEEEIESTQLVCLEFLERLNQGRPSFPQQ
jgi:hypothetical protein